MHPNDNVFDAVGNRDAAQLAGELTLPDMRVKKNTGTEHPPARSDYLPAVREIVSTGIFILNSHLELIARFA